MLVCMAQGSVEAFHVSVGCGVMSGCPRKVNATEFGQGVEEL
jgi:hypothetical protein